MPGVKRVPLVADIGFKPGIEIHRRGIEGDTDIAKIAIAVSGGDIEGAAKRDSQVRKIAAHT